MAGRRTNLALLGLTGLAFVTGFVAFSVGTARGALLVVLHAVVGLSTLLLVRRKMGIARRGMTRDRAGKATSVALAGASVVTVITGVLQVSGLVPDIGPLTTMQVHVGAGVAMMALALVHLAMRPVRPRTSDLSRRNVIRAAGVLGAAGAVYLLSEAIWGASDAPAARRRFTGSHEIAHISAVPATQWLNDVIPRLDASHRVDVGGHTLTAAEIAAWGDTVTTSLDCTGGWYTTQQWSGAGVDRYIDTEAGESIVVRSVTGYWRRFPIEQAAGLLLATAVAGEPLRAGHGAPVRLVAPGRRGFWWVKWVESIEVDDLPPWWQPPLPLA